MEQSSYREKLGFKIKTISMRLAQNMTSRAAPLGLTGSQGFVLGYLCRRRDEVIYPRDIEREFGFSHPTVSGLLQRLEAKGFLVCTPAPDDRRCKRIAVTEKAMQVDLQMRGEIDATERAMLAGMSAAEAAQLHVLLDRVIQNIGPSAGEGGGCP